ncbi:MAG: Clp1/GlmU family protein [archaeon GB-1867-005]|nr:Clp1/GlmU family protein [Candidatus Culexmicrobium cathedralense]
MQCGKNKPLEVIIDKGCTLMVEGPSTIVLKSGEVEVFGAKFKEGCNFEVELFKSLPIYAIRKSKAEIYGGKASLVPCDTIPSDWRKLPSKLGFRKRGFRKVVVLGGIDVGKTGLITFLANKLCSRGLKVGVIDADVGQSDIGPPTTIGLGVVDEPISSLSCARFVDAVFIGLTSPAALLHRAIAAVIQLIKVASDREKCNVILIDTTGWIDSKGRDYKIHKISAISPDFIVGIQHRDELEPILKWAERQYQVLRVPAASYARPRTKSERKAIRESIYKRWFKGATVKELSFDKIAPIGTTLFTGTPIPKLLLDHLCKNSGMNIVYGEKTSEMLILVVDGGRANDDLKSKLAKAFNIQRVQVCQSSLFKNLLVAFQSKDKLFEGLGIIVDADFKKRKFKVLTKVDLEKELIMNFGYIKINSNTFEEEEWLRTILP